MEESSSRQKSAKKVKKNPPVLVAVRALRNLTEEEQTVSFERTASKDARRVYRKIFSTCSVALERGLDFSSLSEDLSRIFEIRGWLNTAQSRKEPVNTTMVTEFYVVLATYDEDKDGVMKSVPLRTVNVPFSSVLINAIYGLPDISEAQDYYNVWNLDDPVALETKALEAQHYFDPKAVWMDNRFRYGNCYRDIRAIKRFLGHSIYPSNVTSYGKQDVCIAWAIVNNVPVDLGKVMFKRAMEFAKNTKAGGHLPFPNLISSLCTMVKVPVLPADIIIPPDITMIGPKMPAHPSGPINFYSPNHPSRQPSISQPIITECPSTQPDSTQPTFSQIPPVLTSTKLNQQFQSTDTQFDANTQAILQAVARCEAAVVRSEQAMARSESNFLLALARSDANQALGYEQVRQWCDDLRIGIRSQRALLRNISPSHEAFYDILPSSQIDPYTLPQWIPPIPPSIIYSPTIGQSSGTGGVFAGTAADTSNMGTFTTLLNTTAGISMSELDRLITMTTPASIPFTDPLHLSQSFSFQGAGLTSSGSFDICQFMSGASYDLNLGLDDEDV